MMKRILFLGLVAGLAAGAAAAPGKRFDWTTASPAAKQGLLEVQQRIESFQFGPETIAVAQKVVAADPEFAMGVYYLSAVTPPAGEREAPRAGGRALEEGLGRGAAVHRRDGGRPREPGSRLPEGDPRARAAGRGLPRRAARAGHPGPDLPGHGRGQGPRGLPPGRRDRPAEPAGPRVPRERGPRRGRVREGPPDVPRRREVPAERVGAVRRPLRPGVQLPLPGAGGPGARGPPRRTWPSTRTPERPRASPRSSSGTRSPASTSRTAGSTPP